MNFINANNSNDSIDLRDMCCDFVGKIKLLFILSIVLIALFTTYFALSVLSVTVLKIYIIFNVNLRKYPFTGAGRTVY